LSEEREITLSEGSAAHAVPVPVFPSPGIEPGHAKVLQGLPQMPGTHGVRLVVVEKLDPARPDRTDGRRGSAARTGTADGIRYLVALRRSARSFRRVRERHDDADQRAGDGRPSNPALSR